MRASCYFDPSSEVLSVRLKNETCVGARFAKPVRASFYFDPSSEVLSVRLKNETCVGARFKSYDTRLLTVTEEDSD